jgi:transporter family protein
MERWVMERWVVDALLAMLFAGVTAVVAKQGLEGVSAELGLAVRTCFVFAFVLFFAAWQGVAAEARSLPAKNAAWLAGSAVTTAASWVFYYRALKAGSVATVSIIDKGSFVVAVLLAALLLGERITPRVAAGCVLVASGLILAAKR